MNYRTDKQGNRLSILGFGCMRFQTKIGKIDYAAAERLIVSAVEAGVNYFDTAYIYPGSEALLGEVLEKNRLRDRVNIATKLPHYLIKSIDGLEKLFQEQLRRLRTDRIDYYLMHMLTDIAAWERLRALGVEDWLAQKQASGAIGQVGFSYHGNSDMFCKLCDAKAWDFCMIQYNYMDEHTQAGRKGLQYAHQKGMPVMIMEPLRGGKLVNRLPAEAVQIFEKHPAGHSPAGWSFRWLWNQPEVTVMLSGMNSMEMLQENLATAATANVGDLGPQEEQMLRQVADAINAKMKVGCTGCGYCMPCPQRVDIPGTFAAYNRRFSENKFYALKEYFMCTTLRKNATCASNCVGCGKCTRHCPQAIAIRDRLADAQKELEGPIFKIARKVARRFVKF